MEAILYIIFLGIIQGVTEFLPVSSSGHLAMLENLPFFNNLSEEITTSLSLVALNVILHIGTLMAVVIFWKKDLLKILGQIISDLKQRDFNGTGFQTVFLITISLIPVLIIPFIKDTIEYTIHSLKWVAGFFILNGLLLIISHRIPRRFKRREAKKDFLELNRKGALLIGIFQAIAVLPGISRSGSTITAGLISGLNGHESVRYSFIISIPVLIAAGLLEYLNLVGSGESLMALRWDWIFVALISSFASGFLSMKFLAWLGRKTVFYPFGIYTILLGCTILFFFI